MSSYVDATASSVEHCELMSQQFPDLAEPYYKKFVTYLQQKLWHQLTLLALEFVGELPSSTGGGDDDAVTTTATTPMTLRPLSGGSSPNTFVALYTQVILKVSNKLNPLSLCRVGSAVAFASWKSGGSTLDEAKQMLQELLSKQEDSSETNVATVLYLQSKIGLLTLTGASSSSTSLSKEELDKINASIKTDSKLLTQIIPDTPDAMVVNSAHYERSMTYYKLVGPPEAFYEEAIHYLNYYSPPTNDSSSADREKARGLAIDLCLAALTGEGVYNLGQVVTNPILDVLASTQDAWLVELLTAVSNGDVTTYRKLVNDTYKPQIASQPALVNIGAQMEEKVILLGLVELVFSKPATDRTLSFGEISTVLGIPLDQVEWVVMRAFSVKLMEGLMDQVDGTDGGNVHITWILPRSLGPDQMADLASRFGEWAVKVDQIKSYMQEETAPALMA